jgi:hypothetical protein
MSFESSGADYLRRLKQDQGQARPFPESTPEPAAPEEAPGERRKNPRYKCEGSATFRVQGTDVRTWGTFTDLSVGGCYIELKATFPVGAIVDLELELNGVRAQVKGEVRISYPFLGMGVAFRDMTVESRQQVDAMIDTVLPSIRKSSAGQRARTRRACQFHAHYRERRGCPAGAGGILRSSCAAQPGRVRPSAPQKSGTLVSA